jgi:hypothetical protein
VGKSCSCMPRKSRRPSDGHRIDRSGFQVKTHYTPARTPPRPARTPARRAPAHPARNAPARPLSVRPLSHTTRTHVVSSRSSALSVLFTTWLMY